MLSSAVKNWGNRVQVCPPGSLPYMHLEQLENSTGRDAIKQEDVKESNCKCCEGLKGVAPAKGQSHREPFLSSFTDNLPTSSWPHCWGVMETEAAPDTAPAAQLPGSFACAFSFTVWLCSGGHSCHCLKSPSIGPFPNPLVIVLTTPTKEMSSPLPLPIISISHV